MQLDEIDINQVSRIGGQSLSPLPELAIIYISPTFSLVFTIRRSGVYWHSSVHRQPYE